LNIEQIQSFLDAGYSSNRIAKYYGVDHTKIDRIIRRYSLEKYEAFDENTKKIAAWDYDEDFKLYKTEDGCMSKEECMVDAIAEFIRQHDIDDITIELLKEYRHIETYSYKVFGSLPKMYEYFGIDKTAVEYSMNKRARSLAALGHEFQRLVKEIYDEIPLSRHSTRGYGDSVPDFISGNTWLDAKLSKSTVFNRGCNTLEKYRKHTDYLVIIYALDDTTATDDRATFVHITEYYPYISVELQRKIDAFIHKASEVKFGGGAA